MSDQEHKFEEGDVVYEVTRPRQLMLITKRNRIVYHCQPLNENGDNLIYMERDLRRTKVDLELKML